MENTESEVYDQKVFKSLVNVIHMITEDARFVWSNLSKSSLSPILIKISITYREIGNVLFYLNTEGV